MIEWLAQYYLYLKALHVIAIIAWMAGLLYLPRLFVYHAGVAADSEAAMLFQVMERRLLRFIMNPAMIASWLLGLLMLWASPALLEHGWMHVKLGAVVAMTVLHQLFARWRKDFATGHNKRPARFYRLWNEAPTLLLIIIVIMAVAEPF